MASTHFTAEVGDINTDARRQVGFAKDLVEVISFFGEFGLGRGGRCVILLCLPDAETVNKLVMEFWGVLVKLTSGKSRSWTVEALQCYGGAEISSRRPCRSSCVFRAHAAHARSP